MKVEQPLGDIVDRLSILALKCARIADPERRAHAEREAQRLHATWRAAGHPEPSSLPEWPALHAVNDALWQVEDALRRHEARGRFGAAFLALARSVYRLNDARARHKRAINVRLDSALVEVKSYGGQT